MGQTRAWQVPALGAVALLGLGLALLLLGWRLHDEVVGRPELAGRLAELEEELSLAAAGGARPAFCRLLPDPGPCKAEVHRWYFLPRSGDCQQFPWGGCRGNDNNFLSRRQCRSACRVEGGQEGGQEEPTTSAPQVVPSAAPRRDFEHAACQLPPQAGPCRDRLTRFYHDSGHCRKFQYGGCAGNGNNFFSLSECERLCPRPVAGGVRSRRREGEEGRGAQGEEEQGGGAQPRRRVDSCSLAPGPGTCAASLTRYWWDGLAGSCRPFQWTGCGGNSNNFGSLAKCVERCGGR